MTKKRVISLVVFVALVSFGLGILNTALQAYECECFDELLAEAQCESICQGLSGSSCLTTGPTAISYCNGTTCSMAFWSYCTDGTSYRRYMDVGNCPDCFH